MHYRSPPGMASDPGDACADEADELVAIESALESAITKASVLPPERGVALKNVDVYCMPVYTYPAVGRKRVIVSTQFEIQVDGNEDACLAVLTELSEAFERARGERQ